MKTEREQHPQQDAAHRQILIARGHRRSFVLRIWIDDASGEARGYLSDVRTNARFPFQNPSELSSLISIAFDGLEQRD